MRKAERGTREVFGIFRVLRLKKIYCFAEKKNQTYLKKQDKKAEKKYQFFRKFRAVPFTICSYHSQFCSYHSQSVVTIHNCEWGRPTTGGFRSLGD